MSWVPDGWPQTLDDDQLRVTEFNAFIEFYPLLNTLRAAGERTRQATCAAAYYDAMDVQALLFERALYLAQLLGVLRGEDQRRGLLQQVSQAESGC